MLTFEGEILRMNHFEKGVDFDGGVQLTVGDDDGDITVWIPAEMQSKLDGLKRLQRVRVGLLARMNEYKSDRDGRERKVKAYRFGVLDIVPAANAGNGVTSAVADPAGAARRGAIAPTGL